MYFCQECSIEFAEKDGYDLHVQSVHSPKKTKAKKKIKIKYPKIASKSSPKKQYVILHIFFKF